MGSVHRRPRRVRLETPGAVGTHAVATMTFVPSQKLSNGATGGTVRFGR